MISWSYRARLHIGWMTFHQVDRVTPESNPKSASLRNFILESPYSPITPRPLPVSAHLLRTRVMLAFRGWLASSFLAFCWTTSGRSLFLTIALRRSRSASYSATHFLLCWSLLITFRFFWLVDAVLNILWLPVVSTVLLRLSLQTARTPFLFQWWSLDRWSTDLLIITESILTAAAL